MKAPTKLRNLNPALPGLLLGIVLIGLVAELIGVWFVPDKMKYTVGLSIGIGLALFMAVHMAIVIADVTDFTTEKQAKAKSIGHSILRYGVAAVALGLMAYFDVGYLLAALLGMISLKLSAYLQPLLHKKSDSFAAGKRR